MTKIQLVSLVMNIDEIPRDLVFIVIEMVSAEEKLALKASKTFGTNLTFRSSLAQYSTGRGSSRLNAFYARDSANPEFGVVWKCDKFAQKICSDRFLSLFLE